jgi:hypothetical protein
MSMHDGRVLALGLALLLVAACSGGSDTPPAGKPGAVSNEQRPAGTIPIPGQEGQMPPGHSPMGGSGKLAWSVPEGWSEQPPASNMRYAQYSVAGPGGSGECVVFYFGPNQGGDAMSNARRWAGQFSQPDGRSSLDLMAVEQLAGTVVSVQVVAVTGTYEGGMTMTAEPAQPKAGYMLLGGIAQGPDAPWFFKFTGPEETVRAQRDAFIEMMSSIRVEG